jgi:hypothetical protein
MRNFMRAVVVLAAAGVVTGVGAGPASAATVCVGGGPACHATIQGAVDAAQDGDRIMIAPGTYAGGIVVDKSVELRGAGARATVISGGGPVVTVGVPGAVNEPTVSISGVAIRDGVNIGDTTVAFGGGVFVPAAAGGSRGATLRLTDSVVTANRATPTFGTPIGPPCPGGPCLFARGDGGGIWTWGDVTLLRTTVSGNTAGGPVASDSHGGGIWSGRLATLRIRDSSFTGNESSVVPPNGRFAIGGGVHIQDGGKLVIANSVVRDNRASLVSGLPGFVEMIANGGGIHVGDNSAVAIENTKIDGNIVVVDDPAGQPSGFDAGLIVGASSLVLRGSSVSDNSVVAHVAATDAFGPSGSALEFAGIATIENTRITGNTTLVTSEAGNAAAVGAVGVFTHGGTSLILNSIVSGNTVTATTSSGAATVQGVGIVNNGALELRNVRVSDNAATANGPSGFVEGGGIWNGLLFLPPPVELTLVNTVVTRNSIAGSPGVELRGGGLFTAFPVTLENSRIERNAPDDCFGC